MHPAAIQQNAISPVPDRLSGCSSAAILPEEHRPRKINLYTVLKNKNTTSLRTPLSDLLRGARKADRVGFAAGGLADPARKSAAYKFFLLRRKSRGMHHVKPKGHHGTHLVNILSNLTRPWEPR